MSRMTSASASMSRPFTCPCFVGAVAIVVFLLVRHGGLRSVVRTDVSARAVPDLHSRKSATWGSPPETAESGGFGSFGFRRLAGRVRSADRGSLGVVLGERAGTGAEREQV